MLVFVKKIVWLVMALASMFTLLMLGKFNLSSNQFLFFLVTLSASTGLFVERTLRS